MAEPKPFQPVKLICGIIIPGASVLQAGEKGLIKKFGPVDLKSPLLPFDLTDYYEREMGPGLKRMFVSFERLVEPESLSDIKLLTNALEENIRRATGAVRRIVNLDPGCLTASSLIMATAKAFSHRIPLGGGIYAHLELLFSSNGVRYLDWTYPDIRREEYLEFFRKVQRILISFIIFYQSRIK